MRRLGWHGFTTIEILVVIGILSVLALAAAPLYASLNNSNQIDSATHVIIQDLYQAQTHSRNQFQDSQWGVARNGQDITLFSGSSYATRNTAYDVTYTVPTAIALSGSTQIVYSKLYGLPTSTGSFSLTANGKTTTVTVNGKGMVDY